jgi:hypothetical protein
MLHVRTALPYAGRMRLLLAVRFLGELGMLACLGIGGWQLAGSVLASAALGLALPLVAAALWGRWVAPRAQHRLRDPARLAVEVALFGVALLVMLAADPSPAMPVVGAAVFAAFLASIPARGHEPELGPAGGHDAQGAG